MLQYLIPVVAALTAQAPAPAAPAQDGSWLAWHGCWRAVDDSSAVGLLCIVPGETADAVRMVTVVDGAVVQESTLRADGVARPVDAGGCRGEERARWSADRRRVFVHAELDCEGFRRATGSVLAMVSMNEWVDIQGTTIHGQELSRTVRYRAVAATDAPAAIAEQLGAARQLARETARTQQSGPLDIAAVVEASRHLTSHAVQALLGARKSGFALSPATLRELKQSGVPAATIDVMVALSYPTTFAVRETQPERRPAAYEAGEARWADPCDEPRIRASSRARRDCALYGAYGPYGYYGWDPYYSRWGPYYSRGYGYGSMGWFEPVGWNYGNPPFVIVRPDEERRQGELVPGRGYVGGSQTTRTAQPRTGTATTTSPTPATSAGSAGSTSSGSTGTTSSGETTTPRVAVPRTGGGGG